MFRDDHEAALARLEALEAELAQEKSKDVKQEKRLVSLETELRAAKDKLRETEAELAKHRPPPAPAPPPATPRVPDDEVQPPPGPGNGAAIAAGVLLVSIVLVGLVLMCRGNSREPDAPRPALPATQQFLPDSISQLLPEIRARGEQQLPGSRLITLRGKGITSDGALHATYGELVAEFQLEVEPSQPEVDPNVPIGAAPRVEPNMFDRFKCVYVVRTASDWQEHSLNSLGMCVLGDMRKNWSTLEPQCSMKSIWARAIAAGAPRDGIAEISLEQSTWRFVINDQRLQFNEHYADDCRR